MGGGLLKTIGYIVLFYFVIRILRNLFEPKNNGGSNVQRPKDNQSSGDFIDYEEVD
jgi:hypothetical protein